MIKALLLDLYELTMAQVYFKYQRTHQATFDLFIRSPRRPFYIACGIDEAVEYLRNLAFGRKDITYLKSLNLFETDFLNYLKDFRFRGDVWAIREPEIVFANEPIIRISGNIIEAQIVESALLNIINRATTLATKAARVVISAKNKGVYDFSLRRTQGFDAALACAYYSYMVGAKGTSNVYAGFLYKIPVVGTMAHSFVMSFEREAESFLAFAKTLPSKSILLIDTYDIKQGITSAIRVAQFLKKQGIEILGIRLDSGNLIVDSRYVRRALDRERLKEVKIFVSGDLDEYKIETLLKAKVPIDAFGVGTRMGCSSDLPYCDAIYKLVEIKGQEDSSFMPTMKFSKGKITLPSKKQIFRYFNKDGRMYKDCLGLGSEKLRAQKLLRKIMDKGKPLYKKLTLKEKRRIFRQKIKCLPPRFKGANSALRFPVLLSSGLKQLTKKLRLQMNKHRREKIIFMDIDTQIDFIEPKGALYVKGAEKIRNNLKRLTNFAKNNRILIISSQDTHTKGDPEFKEFGPHCLKGRLGHKKIKPTLLSRYAIIDSKNNYSPQQLREISQHYPQIILQKNVLDIFSNPSSNILFNELFADKIYVYGLVTEYCVRKAVEGLLARGFQVIVVKDAICELSSSQKQKLFSSWRKRGVKFVTTTSLIKNLRPTGKN